ncbi:MAG: VWA domain-containing protein [Phascolarctobacterium sp.]|nr:VWA domain-containing protein [Phascolarctobacterium sp.]
MLNYPIYPLPAVVGHEDCKQALLIALVNRKAGGLLIGGRKGTAKSVLARSIQDFLCERKFITLPLNVTEDMLFGSIDIEYAVSMGERRFSPGLLARATDNILYIDEANLLRPELLTAVLDSNSAGFNQVERDGISFRHDVRTTVLATMNPDEGTLPGHILDRFGMYVDMQSLDEESERILIMKRVLEYGRDGHAFRKKFTEEIDELQNKISRAQSLLPSVELSDAMLMLAATMCTAAYCAGHRAEIYLLEAAKAIAALAGRSYVLPKDVEEAAIYVLPHRMRKPPEPEQGEEEQDENEESQDNETEENDEEQNDAEENLPPPPPQLEQDDNEDCKDDDEEDESDEDDEQEEIPPQNNQLAPEEQIFDIDRNFKLPKMLIDMGKDQKPRRGSGKRSVTRTDLKQGRYVRAELLVSEVTDLAFDATIRAAAPYQRMREANGCALNIKKEDLRQKVREKRIGNTFLFAVDASGSMGARERMRAVKGAIFYMLQEAYQKRDRVGMLAFRRKQAEVLLPISRSVDLAQKCLAKLPTGGKTPLADGLALSLQILLQQTKYDAELEPILILVTDGRANATQEGEKDPVESAVKIAEKINKAGITSVVIDTEADFIKLGVAKKIAKAMGANYFSLQKLSRDNLIHIVKNMGV